MPQADASALLASLTIVGALKSRQFHGVMKWQLS
jgi:hypothetical protein